MTDVVFELPDANTPGYLRRMKRLLDYQETVKNPDMNEGDRFGLMVRFLLDYVKEPADKDQAYEALLDATKEQIDNLFALIAGKGSVEIPPVKGES